MAFKTPVFPAVDDPEEFLRRPFFERVKVMTGFWAGNGFGSPWVLHLIYIAKLVGFSAVGGLLVVTATSDVGGLFDVGRWWDEPVVYQKLVLWVALLEVVGVGGAWGPLTGHFKPMYGGARYWLRPGTIRLPPWPRVVPFTRGDRRGVVDAVLYAAILVSLAVAIVLPGVGTAALSAARPDVTGGLVRPALFVVPAALLVLLGLRDKVVFLAGRGEQYLPVMAACATLDFTDMIIAAKLIIVIVWVGAAVSKFTRHFSFVVPPMVSNAPFMPRALRLRHYKNAPDDLRPSGLAHFMAHVLGTLAELALPLVLLFSTDRELTLVAVAGMVLFHLFITSTFPLAVPLEWNILFAYTGIFLFAGHPNGAGYGLLDFSEPWMLPVIAGALLFFPVLGNLRPDLVSFLPSMRQYAGNWASAVWALAPGAEERLAELPVPVEPHHRQLRAFGYSAPQAEMAMQMFVAWRSMHTQGKGLLSVARTYLGDDLDTYTVREGEIGANLVVGWNFGDGHLHDDQLIEAIQRRLHFAPGELVVFWVESQPIHRPVQEYFVMDAALGVVERGRWDVRDLVDQQPWLPDGPVPLDVTWRHPRHHPAYRTANGEGALA
ncbi:DUF3556 domain-containing protein [Streptomyces shenzhenensis]|uniref:DUF3556 domain-containing protein n=1 Tax=Streptomyces shenzhenensis TaxID=943815 RepID=UPI0015EFF651|nr:DUF3556 domain-containing protein [Streptomyces shenzhenensis]